MVAHSGMPHGESLIMLAALGRKLGISAEYARAMSSGYAATAVNIAAQIALVPLYLSYLGKQDFGVLMIILAAVNYATIGVTWLAAGTTRIIGEYAANAQTDSVYHAYVTAKIINVGYAIVIGAIAHVLSLLLDTGNPLSGLVPWAVVYLVVLFEFSIDRLALTAMRRQGTSNLISILNSAVAFGGALLVLVNGGRMEHVIGAMTGGIICARLASIWYWRYSDLFKEAAAPSCQEVFTILRRLLGRMGAGYALYGLILLSLLQIDPLVLSWLGGPELVASYILVWKAADVSIQLIWRLPEYLQPKIIHLDAQGETDQLHELYTRCLKTVLGISLLVALLYAALGPFVVTLWVGPEHAPTDRAAYIMAGSAIFWIAGARVPAVFAHARARLRKLNYVLAFELVGKLALTVLLFPVFHEFSPLAAINCVYLLGIFPSYLFIIGKDALANNRPERHI